jgi:membrane fusion protein, multidrug efflux system
MVAPKVGGTVKTVFVADNQAVKKGDLLVELDSVDYDVRVREAASAVEAETMRLRESESKAEAARRQMTEIKAGIEAAAANVTLMKANATQAAYDRRRYESLYSRGAISKERNEKVQTAYDTNLAQLKAAQEQQRRLEASLETQRAVVRQAEAGLETQRAAIKNRQAMEAGATLNQGYTRIIAPADGYVAKKSVEVGNQVSPGQPLMAVVPLDGIWITANFKETQIKGLKKGQKVTIKVDTYPGKRFAGKVDSIMAGTGSAFSLFPPENATGNFVKVVQRVPVKIILDKDANANHLLRVGMSVIPTVTIK